MADEKIKKKRSVGLSILLKGVPNSTREMALLQVRGSTNPEKLPKGEIAESYQGGCQVAVHGQLLESEVDGEDFLHALFREISEELGPKALSFIQHENYESGGKTIVHLLTKETVTEFVVTFGCVLPVEFLSEVRLNPSSGGLRLMGSEELAAVRDLRTFDKKLGVNHRDIIAMFLDEKEAVGEAFKKMVGPPQCRTCGQTLVESAEGWVCTKCELTGLHTCKNCNGPLALGGFCPSCGTGGMAEGSHLEKKC